MCLTCCYQDTRFHLVPASYIALCMFMNSFALLFTVIVLNLYHHHPYTRVPKCLRRFLSRVDLCGFLYSLPKKNYQGEKKKTVVREKTIKLKNGELFSSLKLLLFSTLLLFYNNLDIVSNLNVSLLYFLLIYCLIKIIQVILCIVFQTLKNVEWV